MRAALIAYDILYLTVAATLYAGAAFVSFEAVSILAHFVAWPFLPVPALLVAIVVLIAEVSLLSSMCPRLVPGRYPMLKGSVFYGWILRSLLRRVLLPPGLRFVIFSSNILRFLALRGLGARVDFAANMSSDVDLLDPALLVVGPGATIGARCLISGHYVEKGVLVLDEVRVGAKALLAVQVLVAPGVTVGAGVVVKGTAVLSVGVVIGEGSSIGANSFIDTRARVGAGVSIGPGVHVPARTVIGDHERLDAERSFVSTSRSAAPAV